MSPGSGPCLDYETKPVYYLNYKVSNLITRLCCFHDIRILFLTMFYTFCKIALASVFFKGV